jgi:hypothetical protein
MFLAMDNFVEEAAGCLTEIVLKKMEPLAKVDPDPQARNPKS